MTKVEMINVIKKSNMVNNFSRSYFTRKTKEDVEKFYKLALEYMNKEKC